MVKLKIYNYDQKRTLNKVKVRHPSSPTPTNHILITGGTNTGKTNLLLNLIFDLFYWDSLYICAKDIQEPKYATLLEDCEAAQQYDEFDYQITNDLDEFISLDDVDSSVHNLVVFDDFCGDAKSMRKINEYFVRGRKKNCTVIYITQSYFDTPKIIRLNCSYFCFFKIQDSREIGEIHKSHSCGVSKDRFYQIFHDATAAPYNFLCIDKTAYGTKALRKNFEC